MSIHIERVPSRDLIPATLKPAIARVTDMYVEVFDERLQSVYLLGGATRGEYRPGISDFDLRALVNGKGRGEKERVDSMAMPVQTEFNIAKMELDVYEVATLNQRDWLQFYLLSDGLCVWGKPYEATIPLPTTKDDLAKMLARHLLKHYERMPITLENLEKGAEIVDIETWRTYAKRAIRLGNVVSIFRSGEYTQNVERMIPNIMRDVPEITKSIMRLHEFLRNPPTSLAECVELKNEAETVRQAILKYGPGTSEEAHTDHSL